ncbi:MAG: uracil-DNA glycosylase family protein [Alistipes sp.]|nr:uracil-DNA glycosylase family protein [Alistipes sp.]
MTSIENITIERHPLEPFLPAGARVLMLGSFPPKQERWSMDFFYPNRQNDMWRVMGLIFHKNAHHFETADRRGFDRERIVDFCTEKGIALYDTACQVRRLKDNASDKFLEVVTPTDIITLLRQIPDCRAIITTGEKATSVITSLAQCLSPAVGTKVDISLDGRELHLWRMPSTSRAYPLKLEKKAEFYRQMFVGEGFAI